MDWKIDWEMREADPEDGQEAIPFWWDDMRPKEVLRLIQEVYKRAYEQGVQVRRAPQESPECTK